jgi:hypothetical protein
MGRVLKIAIPFGIIDGLLALILYIISPKNAGSSNATILLILVGLYILFKLISPFNRQTKDLPGADTSLNNPDALMEIRKMRREKIILFVCMVVGALLSLLMFDGLLDIVLPGADYWTVIIGFFLVAVVFIESWMVII